MTIWWENACLELHQNTSRRRQQAGHVAKAVPLLRERMLLGVDEGADSVSCSMICVSSIPYGPLSIARSSLCSLGSPQGGGAGSPFQVSASPANFHCCKLAIEVHLAFALCCLHEGLQPLPFLQLRSVAVLQDPVKLPTNFICDRPVILRHLLSDKTCPFTRCVTVPCMTAKMTSNCMMYLQSSLDHS